MNCQIHKTDLQFWTKECWGQSSLWWTVITSWTFLTVVDSPQCDQQLSLWSIVLTVVDSPHCGGQSSLWWTVLTVVDNPHCGGQSSL